MGRFPIYFSANTERYVFEWHFGTTALVYNDKYNSGEASFSVLPLAAGGFPLLYGFIASQAQGEPKTESESEQQRDNVFRNTLIIFSPLIIANSQHHFQLTKPGPPEEKQWRLSVFAETATNPFILQKTAWLRFAPSAGVSLYRGQLRTPREQLAMREYAYGYALEVGVKKPFDLVGSRFRENRIRPFIGLRVTELF
jgi:hypothetical protein